jgi:hypothetical protein
MPLDFPEEGLPMGVPIRREMPEPPPLVAVEPSPDGDNHPPMTPEQQQTADAVFAEEGSETAGFFSIWGGAMVWGDWAGSKKERRRQEEEQKRQEKGGS